MGIEAIVLPKLLSPDQIKVLLNSKKISLNLNIWHEREIKLLENFMLNINLTLLFYLYMIGNSFVELGWPRTIIIFCTRRLMDVQ